MQISFKRLKDGDWGILVRHEEGDKPFPKKVGDKVRKIPVTKKDGDKTMVDVGEIVRQDAEQSVIRIIKEPTASFCTLPDKYGPGIGLHLAGDWGCSVDDCLSDIHVTKKDGNTRVISKAVVLDVSPYKGWYADITEWGNS